MNTVFGDVVNLLVWIDSSGIVFGFALVGPFATFIQLVLKSIEWIRDVLIASRQR